MDSTLSLLQDIHKCFSENQAGAWALAACPIIQSSLPYLSSHQAMAMDGFSESVMGLREVLESLSPEDPDKVSFELCDRLADVLDFLAEDNDSNR